MRSASASERWSTLCLLAVASAACGGGTGGGLPDSGRMAPDAPPLPECTHYVDSTTTSEDWLAARDIATPCTPQTAMANAQAGDAVCFRGGTYEPGPGPGGEVPAYNPAHSGVDGRPITFMAYPGETALIHEASSDVHPSGTQPAIGACHADHIVWSGFSLHRNLDNGIEASAMVVFESANHVTLQNCDIRGGAAHLDHTNGVLIMVSNGAYVYIHHNRLHDMVGSDTPLPNETPVNTGAMWIFDHDHIYVYNNDIFNVDNGFQMKANPNSVYVYRNHFWNCSQAAFNVGTGTDGSREFEFYQNVIRDCADALSSPDSGRVLYDMRFYNNTIYNSGSGRLAILGKPTAQNLRNTEVFNNIISNQSGDLAWVEYYQGPAFPTYADHNDFHGPGHWSLNYTTDYPTLAAWVAASGLDQSSVAVDPSFVNAGGTSSGDYMLQANSPVRNAGIDRQDDDRDGNTTESIPMGAFILGSETIGSE